MKNISYDFFNKIEHNSSLADIFNKVLGKLTTLRIVVCPTVYERTDDEEFKHRNSLIFYDLCLAESYLHSVIENLERWKNLAIQYNTEYSGSWKYYASSKRMDLIREYGGEDKDYNNDGSINTDVSDDVLINYSIVSDLYQDDWRDIFLQTKPKDLTFICKSISISTDIDLIDIIKNVTGHTMKTYRIKNRRMIENTWAEEALIKCTNKLQADDLIKLFYSIVFIICDLVETVSKIQKNKDNKQFFRDLPGVIDNILNIDFKY